MPAPFPFGLAADGSNTLLQGCLALLIPAGFQLRSASSCVSHRLRNDVAIFPDRPSAASKPWTRPSNPGTVPGPASALPVPAGPDSGTRLGDHAAGRAEEPNPPLPHPHPRWEPRASPGPRVAWGCMEGTSQLPGVPGQYPESRGPHPCPDPQAPGISWLQARSERPRQRGLSPGPGKSWPLPCPPPRSYSQEARE